LHAQDLGISVYFLACESDYFFLFFVESGVITVPLLITFHRVMDEEISFEEAFDLSLQDLKAFSECFLIIG
jgi:hypothetical protein